MWSMKDMFYGNAEPIWILNHDKEADEAEEEKEAVEEEAEEEKEAEEEEAEEEKEAEEEEAEEEKEAEQESEEEEESDVEEENDSSSEEEPEREEYSAPSGSNEAEEEEQSTLANGPHYPYHPPYSSYPYRPDPYYHGHRGGNWDEIPRREMQVVMKIPICCEECEESIKVPLLEMQGVKHVRCDRLNKRVTVITTWPAAPADILLECRRVFKETRMWTDDD